MSDLCFDLGISVDKDSLEREIQKVFMKLPRICADTASHLYIMDAILRKFKQDFGTDVSTDYKEVK